MCAEGGWVEKSWSKSISVKAGGGAGFVCVCCVDVQGEKIEGQGQRGRHELLPACFCDLTINPVSPSGFLMGRLGESVALCRQE